jgi:protein SCO1/2
MKALPTIIILVLVATLVWVVFFWQPQSEPGILFSPGEAKGGDFTLQSPRGPLSLEDLRGKVVLIYFGYTWCPDICPTNLTLMSAALSRLSLDEVEKVQGIFISVDPKRDTLERLATYTQYFNDNLIGATGSEGEIEEIARRYGAAYRIVKQDSATDYVVDHTSETYVVDPQGKLAEILPHGSLPGRILEVVREQLKPQS